MTLTYEDKAAPVKNKTQNKAQKRPRDKPKIPKKITERYLYNSGLAYLQRFPASTSHFQSVMMRKIQKSCHHHVDQNIEECQKLLESVTVKFQELSLLDDAAYLKGMITSLRRRGLSSMQINMRLQQKGYDRETIKNELQKFDEDEFQGDENGDLYAAMIFARKKRLGPFDKEQRKTPEKALATMARAGYGFDIAKKTLGLTIDEIENYS